MPSWLNRAVYQLPRNGTTTHTVDPTSSTNLVSGAAFTPTAGRLLVAVVEGAVTSTTPPAWTQPAGGSAVNLTGLYVWWATAAAGSNAFTTTHNASNYPVVVSIYEFPAGSTFVKSVAATGLAYNAANPALTGLTGTNTVMAVKARGVPDSDAYSFTWTGTGTPVEDWDLRTPVSGTDGYAASLAYVDGFTGTSWQPTATNAVTSGSHEALTFAISVAAGSTTNTGTLSGALPTVTAAIVGGQANAGSVTAAVARPTAEFAGVQANHGILAASAPKVSASITDQATTNVGTLTAVTRPVTATLTGTQVVAGGLAGIVPLVSAQLAGTLLNPAALAAVLPGLRFTGREAGSSSLYLGTIPVTLRLGALPVHLG